MWPRQSRRLWFVLNIAMDLVVNNNIINNGISLQDISSVRIDNCYNARFDNVAVNRNLGNLNVKGFELQMLEIVFLLRVLPETMCLPVKMDLESGLIL